MEESLKAAADPAVTLPAPSATTDWVLVILIAVNAVLLIILIYLWHGRRVREHIYEIGARDQLLAELDIRLANPDYLARAGLGTNRRYPYETKYLSDARNLQRTESPHVGVQVETEMMQQRYFTDTYKPVEVGYDQSCAIVVPDNKIAGRQFVLFSEKGDLYVRNLSPDHTMILERGDECMKLGETAIVICKGDRLLAGSSSFLITMDR